MSRKVFRDLTSVERASELIEETLLRIPVRTEIVTLADAAGRVLAADVESEIDVPSFDRASMDGYAVRAYDTFGAEEDRPVSLTIAGKVGAGHVSTCSVNTGMAIEISTGAPMPAGANAVVMVEYTWQEQSILRVYRSVTPGENVMAAGADIMSGELVLRAGKSLTPRETGVLAAIGRDKVKVFKRPHVAVFSTGDEIVEPGSVLPFGKIYDINGQTLCDSVKENGGLPRYYGILADDPEEIENELAQALSESDMALLSGGTSAGTGDLLYTVIDKLGPPGVLVHGIAVKPGKPAIIGMIRGKPIFGLPGYPSSALMIFNIFVRPVIRKMAGLRDVKPRLVVARTAGRIMTSGGRKELLSVNLIRNEFSGYTLYPVPGESGAITSLSHADGFVEVPEGKQFLESDEELTVHLLSEEIEPADLMIIGSNCLGIELILKLMVELGSVYEAKVINTGSSGGLAAIRRKEADIGGTHLLDENTGTYNIPFLDKYGVADKAYLIRGYDREQGLIVAKGNPKAIHGIDDLLEPDITFMNRNKGSGTRVLLDTMLESITKRRNQQLSETVAVLQGYHAEAKSHAAVAAAVLQGKADAGLAIRAVADTYGLGFVPVAREKYDFLVRRESYEKPSVQAFLRVLASDRFRSELPRKAPGMATNEETGKILHSPS